MQNSKDPLLFYFDRTDYIQIPLALRYEWKFLYASAGPYIGYATRSHYLIHYNSSGLKSEGTNSFGNELSQRVNFSARANVGAQLKLTEKFQLHIALGYDLGKIATVFGDETVVYDSFNAGLHLAYTL